MTLTTLKHNPELDLVLERTIDVPVELVWKAWTEPEQLKKWFCPEPWKTVECDIDLRPGGIFRTVMQGPDGERHENNGCYLEIVEHQILTWTDALEAGYRPASQPNACMNSHFTACLMFERTGTGTKYMVVAKHPDTESCKRHAEIGFYDGWNAALDQLVALAKTMA